MTVVVMVVVRGHLQIALEASWLCSRASSEASLPRKAALCDLLLRAQDQLP